MAHRFAATARCAWAPLPAGCFSFPLLRQRFIRRSSAVAYTHVSRAGADNGALWREGGRRAMNLLERDRELAALHDLLDEGAGHGRIALVSGEAGIGKTALIERFVADVPPGVRTLWGSCE